MGQQIQTAFDRDDETRVAAWLFSRFDLAAAEYPLRAATLSPQSLETCRARRLIVFPQAAVPLLSRHVIATRFAGEFVIESAIAHGATFEWSRITELRPGVFAAGGGDGGRFYFIKSDSAPLNKELSRIVRSLFAYVKKTSPLRSTNRYPRFVGESLASKLRQRTTELLYPNGSPIDLVPNEVYRPANADCGECGDGRSVMS
jgi:hypothetical protein